MPTLTLQLRPARITDRPDIEAISALTWEGTDYLPRYIEAWLADPNGEFYVAESPMGVVGTGKLTKLGAGEWWLEGLRVHPHHAGQGIGRALHEYGVGRAMVLASGVLRFCTEYDNHAVHKMSMGTGFRQTARFLRYTAEPDDRYRGGEAFRFLKESDLSSVWGFLRKSPTFALASGSTCEMRWLCRLITDERLISWAAAEQMLGWYGAHGELDGVIIALTVPPKTAEETPTLHVNYLDAARGWLAPMAAALRGWAAAQGIGAIRHMLPVAPERLVAIEQAGWRRPADGGGRACLFTKHLDTDQNTQEESTHATYNAEG